MNKLNKKYNSQVNFISVKDFKGLPYLYLKTHSTSISLFAHILVHRYVAITNTLSDKKGVSVMGMNPQTFHFTKLLDRVHLSNTCHGIQFSPDSRFVVFTIIDPPGSVEVYQAVDDSIFYVSSLANPDPEQRPKAVCFTPDSKFIAILYSYAAGPKSNKQNNTSTICIHRYVQDTGKIEASCLARYIHQSEINSAFEMGAFKTILKEQAYSLYITDQEDKVFEFKFNPQNLNIECMGSYSEDLPFPHGIDISPDGNFVAVTTLGDDSIRIYKLSSNEADN